ncbi:hypothetical protein [Candidatus Coxiella mudrowiae]|uniref:hypothetical protein n=1 Tax=Candidatus Coxiella mudrowiae TaxID=2054173 RepID=UPI0012FF367A|nr:hypothetical protein [Candidatus Coxiella mudrowiae]
MPFNLGKALSVLITVPFSNPILNREIRAINNSLYDDASFVLQSVKHGRSWKRSIDTGQQVEVPQQR